MSATTNLHQDGSTHEWIPGLGHNVDLIVTMDDATSMITSAFFVEQEGTESTMRGLQKTIEKHGLFLQVINSGRRNHDFPMFSICLGLKLFFLQIHKIASYFISKNLKKPLGVRTAGGDYKKQSYKRDHL